MQIQLRSLWSWLVSVFVDETKMKRKMTDFVCHPYRHKLLGSQVSTRYYRFSDVKSCRGSRSMRGQRRRPSNKKKRPKWEMGRQHQQTGVLALVLCSLMGAKVATKKMSSWGQASILQTVPPFQIVLSPTHTYTHTRVQFLSTITNGWRWLLQVK